MAEDESKAQNDCFVFIIYLMAAVAIGCALSAQKKVCGNCFGL